MGRASSRCPSKSCRRHKLLASWQEEHGSMPEPHRCPQSCMRRRTGRRCSASVAKRKVRGIAGGQPSMIGAAGQVAQTRDRRQLRRSATTPSTPRRRQGPAISGSRNTPNVLNEAVAEITIGLMIACSPAASRRPTSVAALRQGQLAAGSDHFPSVERALRQDRRHHRPRPHRQRDRGPSPGQDEDARVVYHGRRKQADDEPFVFYDGSPPTWRARRRTGW